MERRIAAVLAADMVGFSRLIERDEMGTLKRQKCHLNELIEPTITAKKGRIVKLTGDGLIAEFSSVVEAVQCAVSVQAEMAAREEDFPDDEKIQYRVAVHLGDVVFDDGDVYGDGVNVAARLEGLAAPGGVVVSGTAYDVLKANVDVAYKSLGEQQLKNIATPVRVYQVVEGVPIAPAASPSKRVPLVAAAVVVLAMLGGLLWWLQRPDFKPVDPAEMALTLPQDPSIAVLPFELRGNAGEHDWVADGITDSIIATLSLAPELVVIGRSTMISYKDRNASAADIARELGVRYVMSGSVTVSGDQLVVRTELADALEGNVIWAVQKDSNVNDLMAAQDEIAELVFEETSVALTEGQGAARSWIKAAGGFDTYVELIRGRVEFQKFSPEGHANAEDIWGALYDQNPDTAFTSYLMGYLHLQKLWLGISKDPAKDLAEAERFARQALNAEEFGEGYTLMAYLDVAKGNCNGANTHADRAQALSPSVSEAHLLGGSIKIQCGRVEEGLLDMERGMRMEPNYPDFVPEIVVYARLELGRYDKARELAEAVMASDDIVDPGAKPHAAAHLAVLSVFEGDMTEARHWGQELMELNPKATAAAERASRLNYVNQNFVEKYVAALVAAGIPETAPAEPEETLDPQKDMPSIAVLPFENLSGDPDQEYFADGITEDLITDMSKLSGLLVIARNSTFAYKSRSVPIDEIAKELGVRYVLEGSVRRSGDQVRINAKLIDARTKINLWAERYDGALANVFALQDEVTQKIVSALSVTLTPEEQESLTEAYEVNPEAYDLYLRGQSLVNAYSPQSSIEARDYLERAIALDPSFGRAYAGLALSYAADATFGWSSDPAIAQERAIQYARKALALNSSSPQIYITLAQVYGSQRNLDAGIEEVERAIALDPDFADAYVLLGMFLSFSGKPDEGIQSIRKAMELSPQHGYIYPYGLAVGYFVKGQYDEAIAILESVLERNSNFQQGRLLYIAILGLLDRTDDAEWEAEEVLAALPNFSIAEEEKRVRYIRENDRERYVSGLRKAGLPE
ncbi:adenylate/guanylate cyclase domain-containing protein [Marimonas sp. MJW-29]|uniref:Adenylate/guanylate cyclase domain-containing protein n=1 Tax=Sulfitobacter sediminis TaxID=3234186 RepID=A0ABV3RU27_9RHOB